jgi:hypothetical protein
MVQVTWLLLAMLLLGGAWICARFLARPPGISLPGVIGSALLVIITAWALYLRLRVVPHHHGMYVDEPWYEESARNFLRGRGLVTCEATDSGESCAPYVKAAGWPAILSLAFLVGGIREQTALLTSSILGGLAAPAAAGVVLAAQGSWPQALLAAALLAIHPLHVQWSGTAETNAASVTFLLSGLAGFLLWWRRPSLASAAAAGGGIGTAAAVRPELWLAFFPAVGLTLWQARRERSRLLDASVLGLSSLLGVLPGIASRGAFSVHSKGEVLRLSYVADNARAWLGSVPEGGPLTALIIAAAVVGTLVLARSGRWVSAITLAGTAAGIALFVLLYYPPEGFYARTMLGALGPAVALAAIAVPFRPDARGLFASAAVVALIAGVGWHFRGSIERASETQQFETQLPDLAREVSWPPGSVVLAEWPTVLAATTDLSVMSTSRALAGGVERLASEAERRPIFLACDMFCEPGFGGGEDHPACDQVLDQFALEPVRMTGSSHRQYGFFRIMGRRTQKDSSRRICPMVPR